MTDEETFPIRSAGNDTGDRFLVYQTAQGPRLDLHYKGDDLWMTQAQIAQLFGRDPSVVSRHATSIIAEKELEEATSVRRSQTAAGRPDTLYNLDMVISIGYRVSSAQATVFRRWATGALVQFAKAGYAIDRIRLQQPEHGDRIAEMRQIISDLRSDEANVYMELMRICSLCQDFDPNSKATLTFFMRMQAKLVYAVTSRTPAEVIIQRANFEARGMGLQALPEDDIGKGDVGTAKNYLTPAEIQDLNCLTTILLDVLEEQLNLGRIVVMRDAQSLFDNQLHDLGRSILQDDGSVRLADARQRAEWEYESFKARRKLERRAEACLTIETLVREARALPQSTRKPNP